MESSGRRHAGAPVLEAMVEDAITRYERWCRAGRRRSRGAWTCVRQRAEGPMGGGVDCLRLTAASLGERDDGIPSKDCEGRRTAILYSQWSRTRSPEGDCRSRPVPGGDGRRRDRGGGDRVSVFFLCFL